MDKKIGRMNLKIIDVVLFLLIIFKIFTLLYIYTVSTWRWGDATWFDEIIFHPFWWTVILYILITKPWSRWKKKRPGVNER